MERQIKINFDPVEHKYTDESGLVYTSVTTLIDKYKPKFNKKYWSMYVALRDSGFKVRPDGVNGGSPACKVIYVNDFPRKLDELYSNPIKGYLVDQVLDKWTKLTQIACDRGNEVHDFLEDSINLSKEDKEGNTNNFIKPNLKLEGELLIIKTKHDLDKTQVQKRYPVIYNRLLKYINLGCTLFAEKRIYTTQYQIAGMIDVLIVQGKKFAILDWKTNKDVLMFNSGYFKKRNINGHWVKTSEFIPKKEYFYSPLNHVELCKGMTYSLQLSLYAYIMELWGYTLIDNGLEIFHIREGLEPKLLKVAYKKQEIHKMLNHHKNTRVNNNSNKGTIFGIYE